jgi:hypothetical protein
MTGTEAGRQPSLTLASGRDGIDRLRRRAGDPQISLTDDMAWLVVAWSGNKRPSLASLG